MASSVFESFRLVGGTALSLQLEHRMSADIDLFSELPYGSVDFSLLRIPAVIDIARGACVYQLHQ